MSTLEKTVSMVEQLPEADLQFIFVTAKALLDNHTNSPFKPLSREQILEDLSVSRKQMDEGQYSSIKDTLASFRREYGL